MAISSVSGQKTIQQIIDDSSKATSNRNTGELGKNDFLSLLVTQLRYQDPLKPTDDKEFIGQMAQFSSLEQMQNMNTSFSSVKALNLVGKNITATLKDETTGQEKVIDGEVTSVKLDKDKAYVMVKGEEVPVDQITDITDGLRSNNSNISTYTNLIGFDCKGVVYDSSNGDIVPVKGTVKEIQKGQYEDYAVMDGVSVQIASIASGTPTSSSDYKRSYLEAHKGDSVDVNVIDNSTGKVVPVTATLRDYSVASDGTITGILDKLNVPVESISNIKPQEQQKAGA
ncbi:MAG: flagellar hook capping FlgD N-terminal domain-containing protein [Bacillota bacterium]|nr:flagellar hook capping FlgD N-terminal domain-containing protein [Bacillota bacterium]